MTQRPFLAGGALLAALLVAPGASAQDARADAPSASPAERATARRLMDEGDAHVARRRLDEALEAYEAADAIMHVPTTAIEVAKTDVKLGRLLAARSKALEIGRMPGAEDEPRPFAAARREAALLAERLEDRIPTLQVHVTGAGADANVRATLDGQPAKNLAAPVPLDPGHHVVEIRARGGDPVRREVELAEGAREVVTVDVALSRGAAGGAGGAAGAGDGSGAGDGGMPATAIAGLAVAGTGVVIGSLSGILSLSKASQARALCGPDPKSCDPAASDAISSSRTLGWVSTLSFGVAIAGAGLATYSLLSARSDVTGRRVEVVMTGAGGGVRGTF
jgi:hypothetical protein